MLELQARTPAGRRLIQTAERLGPLLAADAEAHDRDGTFPHHHVDALADSGYLTGPVPAELGGGGVESVHDLLVATARLARAHAAIALGTCMHAIPLVNTAHRWRLAVARGESARAELLAGALEAVVRDRAVIATAVSERGGDLTRPATRARRSDGGWVVDGTKVLCTLSPSATLLYAAVTYPGPDGDDRYAYARIPADAPGVTVHDDWDALGMRASGSNTVTFEGVRLPADALGGGVPAGRLSAGYLERSLVAGALHAATSAGIAEGAHALAAEGLARRNGSVSGRARVRALAAENAIELTAMRAALARAGDTIDGHHASGRTGRVALDEITGLFADVQAVKAFVTGAATRIVDRCVALVGGAAYGAGHPLGRALRDVRAAQFMNPLAADRAHEFLADRVLGLDPSLS
jgi:alkylation response protein AidB-like acyl-CoA dehydrogenase